MPMWWNYMVPPILGSFYVLLLISSTSLWQVLPQFFVFVLSILGTAALGYWINDWADQPQDEAVGKANATSGRTISEKWMILLFLMLPAALPWWYLPGQWYGFGLWGILLLCFLLYSVPPFRFKERGVPGILLDMCYGHLLPVLICVGTFADVLKIQMASPYSLPLLIGILTAKGLRNIIQHQIEDRKKDEQQNIRTFVVRFGGLPSALLISFFLLPLELLLTAVLCLLIYWPLFLIFLLFIVTYAIKVYTWKYSRSRSIRWCFYYWYIMNDFYEATFPLSVLLLLCFENSQYILLLIVHLIFFQKTLIHWQWTARQWLHLSWWKYLRRMVFF